MGDPRLDSLLALLTEVAARIPEPTLLGFCDRLELLPAAPSSRDIAAALDRVADPRARASLADLTSRWLQANEGPSLESLSWALRSAAYTDQWWRENRRLEVVWTGPAPLAGMLRRTEQALIEVIDAAREELWVASFVGYRVEGVETALQRAADRRTSINLVSESADASGGRVAFSWLEQLGHRLGDLASVYHWPSEKRPRNESGQYGSFHPKCAIADDERLFVGSANVTGYAMALNMELGLLVRGGHAPRRARDQFRWLVQEGQLLRMKRQS